VSNLPNDLPELIIVSDWLIVAQDAMFSEHVIRDAAYLPQSLKLNAMVHGGIEAFPGAREMVAVVGSV
jgi:hypothetical protein